MLHTHLLLPEGLVGESWESSKKAILFQKTGERNLIFFSDFREFKELGIYIFFTSDQIS
jgi:hypothetical protein